MEFPKRKTIRLKNYDYAQNGAYFVTICTHNRACLFGEIAAVGEGFPLPNVGFPLPNVGFPLPNVGFPLPNVGFPLPNIRLNENGNIINESINIISLKYNTIKIDKYIIMPNHIHLIVVISNGTGNPSPTIGHVLGWFKYQTTKQINQLHHTEGTKLWQRSYHDHIIRDEQEYQKIWEYIDTNPFKWELDCYHVK